MPNDVPALEDAQYVVAGSSLRSLARQARKARKGKTTEDRGQTSEVRKQLGTKHQALCRGQRIKDRRRLLRFLRLEPFELFQRFQRFSVYLSLPLILAIFCQGEVCSANGGKQLFIVR